MDKTFMSLAISKAWEYQFLTYPNPAVGACIVQDNKILSIEAHKKASEAHAEVIALKYAYLKLIPNSKLKNIASSKEIHNYLIKNHNDIFHNCEIYVTLEPCNHIGKTPSCAYLLKKLKIKKVYIGTLDTNTIASGGAKTLQKNGINIEILNDIKCNDLVYPFRLWQQEKFRFFKLAIREDGSCDGGYITSSDSLNLVHEIRTKIDLLIIGGNTVRVDRPTLDSRFAKINKTSDILIYSRQKKFDKSIPLFNIKNRDVFINNNINYKKVNFSMIEGGYNLLKNIKDDINMLMLFISHKDKTNKQFDISILGFDKVYSYFINKHDEIVFFK
jgi:diaminohydroxyphosphoribosylaminopyrimidine deaminase/5-amino-6-(5-phosphoribosylamino)uracil reductase